MRRAWQQFGIIVYWITIPGIWLVLRKTKRTRLLIVHKNMIVVVKPWLGNGKWCLPGGGLHRGESASAGLLREVKEEIGLRLASKACTSLGEQQYQQNGLNFFYQLFTITLPAQSSLTKQRREIVEARWIDIQNLNADNANSDVLSALGFAQIKV